MIFLRRFLRSKKRNSVAKPQKQNALRSLRGKKRGRAKIFTPYSREATPPGHSHQPLSFLPERKLSKVGVGIFAEKSSDFVQDRQPTLSVCANRLELQ